MHLYHYPTAAQRWNGLGLFPILKSPLKLEVAKMQSSSTSDVFCKYANLIVKLQSLQIKNGLKLDPQVKPTLSNTTFGPSEWINADGTLPLTIPLVSCLCIHSFIYLPT